VKERQKIGKKMIDRLAQNDLEASFMSQRTARNKFSSQVIGTGPFCPQKHVAKYKKKKTENRV
jgi:hypothetical protein